MRRASMTSNEKVTLKDYYDQPEEERLTWQARLANKLRIKNDLIRGSVAEFFATFILMLYVQGTVASMIFAGKKNDLLMIAIGQGLAVTYALYVGGGVSGAYLNPAVNVAFALLGKLKWVQAVFFSVAQYLAAFTASMLIYAMFYEAQNTFDSGVRVPTGPNGTAGIYTTFPGDHRSVGGAFFHETFCTALLLIGVLAMSDSRNWKPAPGLFPFSVGFLITLINLAFSWGESLAMNPARDLGPRLFVLIAGWGPEVFSIWDYNFFWIPIVGSHLGAIIGAILYSIFIEFHHPPEPKHQHKH
ncbi:putative Aquaporin-10 [Hypsibius exemplaris]|uniref:Aquaporin-10 n=1 Tax=Hypsibius exemplaris TaxID=2072580 RepID=A0A1W0X1F3_HYPEX|nr:putative Aquaporin-10 [Hypsibius exemplaris]